MSLLGRFFSTLFISWWRKPLYRWWRASRLSRRRIAQWVDQYKIDLSEYDAPAQDYHSLAHFCERKLKKGARTIDKTPHTVCAPADGMAFVIAQLNTTPQFYAKEQAFSLASFVGSTQRANRYRHGSMIITRLQPHDYRRFHMPVAGYIKEVATIAGSPASLEPNAYEQTQPLLTNRRHIFEITTAADQQLLMVCVGTLTTTYNKKTNYLLKATELGYAASPSAAVCLIAPPSLLHIRTDLINHSMHVTETPVAMGTAIGRWAATPTLDTAPHKTTSYRHQ